MTRDVANESARQILALCSATTTASVALLRGQETLVCLSAAGDRHQSESLLPLIDQVLRDAGLALDDLDGLAVSIGPGAFTSLRIGLATAKGLVLGSGLAIAPVSTLQAMAAAQVGEPSERGRPLIALLDARRDEVYAAAFAGALEQWRPRPEILPERVYSAAELAERIPGDSILLGEGVPVVAAELRERLGDGLEIRHQQEPGAEPVGRLGEALLSRGEGADAASLAPHYVRRAEAEVTRTAERFEGLPNP